MIKNGENISCDICDKEFYASLWQLKQGRKFCSSSCYHMSSRGRVPWNKNTKGIMKPNITSFKTGDTSGINNINWKGGITKDVPRFTNEYKQWRTSVFERDNYTCVWCGKRGGELEADHKFPQALFPELRFRLDNGRTLCKECHKKTFTYLNPHLTRRDFSGITGEFAILINESPVEEPSDSRYRMWNTGSVECEVGEFFFGLVRMIKPEHILETGTYKGWSTAYMAKAIKENRKTENPVDKGNIETLEIEDQHINSSKDLWQKLGLQEIITSYKIPSLDFQPTVQYDLIFLDSEPYLRFDELIKFFPFLKPGGFVFIHDLHRHFSQTGITNNGVRNWPYGDLPEQIKNWIKDRELVPFYFPTPRGLTGLYKPGVEDYRP
mgnify:CR=1 FL=1